MEHQTIAQHSGRPGPRQPRQQRAATHPAPEHEPLSHERVRELLGWRMLQGEPDDRSAF